MNIRRRIRNFDDPSNSGALNDLAFLLIIYFIVIAGFQVHQGFLLNLPQKNSATWIHREDLLHVALGPSGELSLEGEAIDRPTLETAIIDTKKQRPNLTIRLEVDPETPYGFVIGVVETVHKLQVENFSFAINRIHVQ